MFTGILLHKGAEAFALGVRCVRNNVARKMAIILVLIFAIVAPIGVAIGFGVGEALEGEILGLVSSILNSFAVGVFLYVSILGVIVEEFSSKDYLIPKFFLALVGCAAMGCLSFFE